MTADPIAVLLFQIAAQDRRALRELYDLSAAKLMGVLLRILGERAEAEDALQEVFTRVWLRAARFDATKGRGMTWLIAVARHHAIDRLRRRDAPTDGAAEMETLPDPQPGVERQLIARGEARRIANCLSTLEPDRASALRGAYLDGLSYADLAERHAIPLNTLRTWLRRGLLRLKDCLDR